MPILPARGRRSRPPRGPFSLAAALGIAAAIIALGLGTGSNARADVERAPGLAYRVTFDPSLSTAKVSVTVSGFVPRVLVVDYDRALAHVSLGSGLVRDEKARGVTVESLSGGGYDYVVDFASMARDAGESDSYRVGSDLVTMPTRWLLRPARAPKGIQTTLTLDLPPGTSASVPWQPLPRSAGAAGGVRYRLDETVWRFESRIAIGRFTPQLLEVGGAAFEVAVLDRPHRATSEGIRRWISEAARAVSLLEGRFPLPRVQVLVQPTEGGRPGGPPVVFGTSRQGGGGGVLLHLSAAAADAELPGEWVAVHELAHFALPPMADADAWFYEGIATYYQEVLRARAGFFEERRGWQEIHEGFLRGTSRPITDTLAEDSAAMKRTHRFFRVYWSGAALALRFDVALRRASKGRLGLGDALERWMEQPGARTRLWTAEEACRALDQGVAEATGEGVFTSTAQRWLPRTEFPPYDDLYAALGIRVEERGVRLVDDAPEAALRRAIMGAPQTSARQPSLR